MHIYISRYHISCYYGHSIYLNTDTLYKIIANRLNYSDVYKNGVRYNIDNTNEVKFKNVII